MSPTGPEFDPAEWAAVSALLDEWAEMHVAARPAWLDALRARDPRRHASLTRLLAAEADAAKSSFLGSPAVVRAVAHEAGTVDETEAAADPPESRAGSIGPYRLLAKLGQGGMGEVWLAEQITPVRRQVALKLIKQGMDTRHVIARFEAERQALAMMDHPCVAKVFEAGSTAEGKPYFAMEYVKGIPITDYCDRTRLSTRERLELFVALCEGVQHAHQKAIIHRDLKPSNVLVFERDGHRVPKVIDFGVAKATASRLTDKTMFTELGMLIGTPEYMSPEQADPTGEDIDTRTDVYSLGVILYELLVGALPFDSKQLRSGGFDGIRRVIRNEEPKRPSTRFATLGEASGESAAQRGTDRSTLLRLLRGDLDWITMKALEKDRARRYGSPMELAADIGRYLRDEAVQARPPSTGYRMRKFVRRHRLGVTTAALMSVALLTAVVGTAIGLVRARRAEAVARSEQARAEKVAKFLTGTLQDLDPLGMGNKVATEISGQLGTPLEGVNTMDVARHLVDGEILRKTVTRIDSELGNDPALATTLYHTIGMAERNLELYDAAREMFGKGLGLSTRVHGAESPITLDLQDDLANSNRRAGRYVEAEAVYAQLVVTLRRVLGEETRQTLRSMNMLGDMHRILGRDAEAEPLLRETLEKTRRVLGDNDQETLDTRNNLALVLRDQRRYAEAESLLRETVEKMKRFRTDDPGTIFNSEMNLAVVLHLAGRPDEAVSLLERLRAESGSMLGEDSFTSLRIRMHLGDAYAASKRYEEAEPTMRDTLVRMQRALGAQNPETINQTYALADFLMSRGQLQAAEPMLVEAIAGYERAGGERHFKTLRAVNTLGSLYVQQGRLAEAEKLFSRTAADLEPAHPVPLDAVYSEATFQLACLAARRGERASALAWLEKSVRGGPLPPERIASSHDLAPLRGAELDALVHIAHAE